MATTLPGSLRLSQAVSFALVQVLPGVGSCRRTLFNVMELTRRHRMLDFEFDLAVHLSGEFYKKPPPLGYIFEARDVPLPERTAYSVMRVFDLLLASAIDISNRRAENTSGFWNTDKSTLIGVSLSRQDGSCVGIFRARRRGVFGGGGRRRSFLGIERVSLGRGRS